jgi:ribosomal protein S18 acetylase RimI-like enzyme
MKTTKPKIEIINYSTTLAPLFYSINAQWINDMFVLEEIDKEVLGNPQHFIIDNGGYIWFAKASNEIKAPESKPFLDNSKYNDAELADSSDVVGTCALLKRGEGAYELTKMGVLSSARGLKVGEVLLQHVIEQAKLMQVKDLFLLTNKNCEAAIHLYEKNGFTHSKRIMDKYGAMYSRCDVAMEYVLTA